MDMTGLTLEQAVGAYVKIRDAIRETEERHKSELEEMKVQLDIVANHLLEICNKDNVDSIRTPAGTLSRRVQTRYWASDWDAMYEFIIQNEAPQLLERRIHNGNMQEFLEDNPDLHPAGLQADRKYRVQVRKPTSK